MSSTMFLTTYYYLLKTGISRGCQTQNIFDNLSTERMLGAWYDGETDAFPI